MYNKLFTAALSVAIICLTATTASAQFAIVDNLGKPFMTKAYTDVRGSAYLYEDWQKGSVTLDKGTTYDGVELMYDLVADEIIFKSESGEAKTFIHPVMAFSIKAVKDGIVLQDQVFRRGFIPVDGAHPNTFYEVLVGGQTQLLKRRSKKVFEEIPYGSSTKVKFFQEETTYYLAKDTKLTKIKRDKKALLNAFGNKTSELEAYIKNNRLDLKKDSDLIKLVAYYNSL